MDMSRENRVCSNAFPLAAGARRTPRAAAESRLLSDRDAFLDQGAPRESRSSLDEALSWIVRLKSGSATEADLEALRRWREEDPLHEEGFRDAARLWRRVGAAARELAEEERAAGSNAPRDAARDRSWRGAWLSLVSALIRDGRLRPRR